MQSVYECVSCWLYVVQLLVGLRNAFVTTEVYICALGAIHRVKSKPEVLVKSYKLIVVNLVVSVLGELFGGMSTVVSESRCASIGL